MNGFRCPQCGQAHEMIVGEHRLTMNKEMTELYMDGEKDPEGLDITGSLLVTCTECNEESPVETWKDAFDEPLMFFEMEQLCHCGGELWMDQIPGTRNYGFVCDKCNWVKPKQVVSGS